MFGSILFDSTQLQNTTYIPRTIDHESAPERLINLIKLARQDGSIIIDDTFGEKYITIPGILKGSSQSDLEQKIDAFKELISRKDKNLDIDFAGGTRRYVCRSVSHEFNRDFFHLLYVPYTVKFYVVGSIGKDTAETTAINVTGIVATSSSQAPNFGGSYRPKPRHKITFTTIGNAAYIRLTNSDTGDYMEVDVPSYASGDYVEIDEENQTVKKNGSTNIDYRGKFPSVKPGVNNLLLTINGAAQAIDQQQTSNHGGSRGVIYDTGAVLPWGAQSFVPAVSGYIKKIGVYIDKTGAIGGSMQWHFCVDDNGKPGARVGDEEYTIAAASVPSSGAWTDVAKNVGTTPFLVAGQRYWLVENPGTIASSDASKFYGWYFSDLPTDYANGKAMAKTLTASAWQDGIQAAHIGGVQTGSYDYMFEIYVGDGAAASHSVAWRIDYTKKYL